MIEVLLTLDDETLDKDIVSSFRSLRLTALHIWSAEQVWYDRLMLVEHPVWVQDTFTGSFAEACANWQKVSADLLEFINRQFDDRGLEHVVQYFSLQKKSFKSPVYTVLQQVFNHGTYHRGQLVTMLRQAGVKKIPCTDLIIYSREKKS